MHDGAMVIMVTVSERVPMLNNFLRSLVEHEPGRPIHIHLQDYLDVADRIEIPKGLDFTMQVTKTPVGCHAARVMALRWLADAGVYATHYVNVDDDVTLTPTTHWQPAIDKTDEPGVGFVLTNWVRHPNLYEANVPKMKDEFLKQVFVYNGGGMAYTETVADLMRDLDPVPARYDDIWPLTAYLNGFQNYRYRGSLSIHQIMVKGGMKRYMDAEPRPLLCERWVNYRRQGSAAIGREVAIPMDSDLKEHAKALHWETRREKGWA